MTDECEDFWNDLCEAATTAELQAVEAAAVRAGLFRRCNCGKLLEPTTPRCWECKAWRSDADRQKAEDLIELIYASREKTDAK